MVVLTECLATTLKISHYGYLILQDKTLAIIVIHISSLVNRSSTLPIQVAASSWSCNNKHANSKYFPRVACILENGGNENSLVSSAFLPGFIGVSKLRVKAIGFNRDHFDNEYSPRLEEKFLTLRDAVCSHPTRDAIRQGSGSLHEMKAHRRRLQGARPIDGIFARSSSALLPH